MKQKTAIRKTTEQLVYSKIEEAISDIGSGVKKKKLSKDLKKASKIIAKDISKAVQKEMPAKAPKAKKSKKVKKVKPPVVNKKSFVYPVNDHNTTMPETSSV